MEGTVGEALRGKVLGVDLDGVCADWVGGVLDKLRDMGHNPILPHQVASYHMEGLLSDAERVAMAEVARRDGFFYGLESIDDFHIFLRRMDGMGVNIFFVTSPYDSCRTVYYEKMNWVVKYMGLKFKRRLILTHDKTMVDLDVLIDDKPEITGLGPARWTRIVFDQPYNHHTPGPRMYSWRSANDQWTVINALLGGYDEQPRTG